MVKKSNKGSSTQAELILLDARSTLSPEEAARYLSLRSQVGLATDALWAHVLEGHLPVAIEFERPGFGRRGRVVAHNDGHKIADPVRFEVTFTEPLPLEPAVRLFATDLVVELDGERAERLPATCDLCCAGAWQDAARQLRRGPTSFHEGLDDLRDALYEGYPSVLVAQPDEPDVAWEISDRDGSATSQGLKDARAVFRRDALEAFLRTFLEPAEDPEHKGELNMTTLLQMIGALIQADGTRKKVFADLLNANIRGFGPRNLDTYLAAASEAFDKARRGSSDKIN